MHATAIRRTVSTLLALAILALAAWALHRQFSGIAAPDVLAAMGRVPAWRWGAAAGLTALSFAALAAYDALAVAVVAPGRVGRGTALLAGGVGNALSNTLGFHAVTGTAVRLRIYRSAGLGTADAARIVSLSWLALGLGFLSMLGLALGIEAISPPGSLRAGLGAVVVACLLLALTRWLSRGARRVTLFGFSQPLPSGRVAVMQMVIGSVETAAALGALYLLLPADLAPSFSVFAVGCIFAILLGILAHAPGGVGVFEASITSLLAGAGRADLLAALLLYRLIYNALPFVLAACALAVFEWRLAMRPANAVSSTGDSA